MRLIGTLFFFGIISGWRHKDYYPYYIRAIANGCYTSTWSCCITLYMWYHPDFEDYEDHLPKIYSINAVQIDTMPPTIGFICVAVKPGLEEAVEKGLSGDAAEKDADAHYASYAVNWQSEPWGMICQPFIETVRIFPVRYFDSYELVYRWSTQAVCELTPEHLAIRGSQSKLNLRRGIGDCVDCPMVTPGRQSLQVWISKDNGDIEPIVARHLYMKAQGVPHILASKVKVKELIYSMATPGVQYRACTEAEVEFDIVLHVKLFI